MRATVSFTIDIPADCTRQEAEDWIEFQLGEVASISHKNPLCDEELCLSDGNCKNLSISIS